MPGPFSLGPLHFLTQIICLLLRSNPLPCRGWIRFVGSEYQARPNTRTVLHVMHLRSSDLSRLATESLWCRAYKKQHRAGLALYLAFVRATLPFRTQRLVNCFLRACQNDCLCPVGPMTVTLATVGSRDRGLAHVTVMKLSYLTTAAERHSRRTRLGHAPPSLAAAGKPRTAREHFATTVQCLFFPAPFKGAGSGSGSPTD